MASKVVKWLRIIVIMGEETEVHNEKLKKVEFVFSCVCGLGNVNYYTIEEITPDWQIGVGVITTDKKH